MDAVHRGLDHARAVDAAHVEVWSAIDVERPELVDLGFEVGWQPWWMGRSTAGVDEGPLRVSRRAVISVRARPREQARQPLLDRDDIFRVEARADGRYAGRISLNATPEGFLPYAACGFTRLGAGRTWWWHRDRARWAQTAGQSG